MINNKTFDIITDPEFANLIPAQSEQEYAALEEAILRDGCTDPLIIWKYHDVLIDGHNRKKICDKFGLPYKVCELDFNSREEVADWIDSRQLGRRNLTPDQMSLLRGRRYNRQKKQGKRNDLTSPQYEDKSKTSEILAQEHGVSRATIERDGQFVDAVEKIGIGQEIANGSMTAPKSAIISESRQLGDNPSEDEVQAARERIAAHVAHNSGDNEWYTPEEYTELARQVMGSIDLDPASCVEANKVVRAASFYSKDDNGLEHDWFGNIFMNPPYSQPWIQKFVEKLSIHLNDGSVPQAVVLVNNATETQWGQLLLKCASAVCFPGGRIKFWHPDKKSAPLQGQMIIYAGNNFSKFKNLFSSVGEVCYAG
jgi:ParB family chromosome partitioning protein